MLHRAETNVSQPHSAISRIIDVFSVLSNDTWAHTQTWQEVASALFLILLYVERMFLAQVFTSTVTICSVRHYTQYNKLMRDPLQLRLTQQNYHTWNFLTSDLRSSLDLQRASKCFGRDWLILYCYTSLVNVATLVIVNSNNYLQKLFCVITNMLEFVLGGKRSLI